MTRGAAPRTHAFPNPPVKPTVYGFRPPPKHRHAWHAERRESGSWLAPDPRWNRCDIKSTALIANILPYQEAHDRGFAEVCFVRNGVCDRRGTFQYLFSSGMKHFTPIPKSNGILSGITRKNVSSTAAKSNGIQRG
ncbi:MAG: aminotransferase class IV [Marinilabiliales bacterium]|nr:aminotransferase class IV [Marinilabiliales bacterium]